MKHKSLVILTLSMLVSCISPNSKGADATIKEENTLSHEKQQLSEERIHFLYDSLIGNMPREEIGPYMDSLQGRITPAYKTPESWKLKETTAIAMLYDWNGKHNDHTASQITNLYADFVDFYGKTKELEEITSIKTAMFKRYPDFYQEIIPSSIKPIGEGYIKRIEYTKRVNMSGKTRTFNSFLEFGGTHGAFFIIGEGDIVE